MSLSSLEIDLWHSLCNGRLSRSNVSTISCWKTRSGAHRDRLSFLLLSVFTLLDYCYMLASLRRSRSTLLYQATPLLAPFSFAPSSSVRFLRTPRHTRSTAARARTSTGDGAGPPGSSFVQSKEDSGLKRIRGLNPREVSQPFSPSFP